MWTCTHEHMQPTSQIYCKCSFAPRRLMWFSTRVPNRASSPRLPPLSPAPWCTCYCLTSASSPYSGSTYSSGGEPRETRNEGSRNTKSELYLLKNTQTDRGKQAERKAWKLVNMVLNNRLHSVQQRLVWAQIGYRYCPPNTHYSQHYRCVFARLGWLKTMFGFLSFFFYYFEYL